MQKRSKSMKFLKSYLLLLILFPVFSYSEPMECKIGPIEKEFGGTKWIVYACSDQESIVVVSAPGNPAMPFLFSVSLKGGEYVVTGEGNGDRAFSNLAYDAISRLTKEQIQAMLDQAINS